MIFEGRAAPNVLENTQKPALKIYTPPCVWASGVEITRRSDFFGFDPNELRWCTNVGEKKDPFSSLTVSVVTTDGCSLHGARPQLAAASHTARVFYLRLLWWGLSLSEV